MSCTSKTSFWWGWRDALIYGCMSLGAILKPCHFYHSRGIGVLETGADIWIFCVGWGRVGGWMEWVWACNGIIRLVFWSFPISTQCSLHSSILRTCSYIFPLLLFKHWIFRVVLIWDIVEKSNCHLMHVYPVSKQMINKLQQRKYCV